MGKSESKSILEIVIGRFQEMAQQSLRRPPEQDRQGCLDQFTPSTAADGTIHYLDPQGNVVAILYEDGTVELPPDHIDVALVSQDPNVCEAPAEEFQQPQCSEVCEEGSRTSGDPQDLYCDYDQMSWWTPSEGEKADDTLKTAKRFGDRPPVPRSARVKSGKRKSPAAKPPPPEDKPPPRPDANGPDEEIVTYSEKLDDFPDELSSDESALEEDPTTDGSPKACGVMSLEEQSGDGQAEQATLFGSEPSPFNSSTHLFCFSPSDIPGQGDGDDTESPFFRGTGQKEVGQGSQTIFHDSALAMVEGRDDRAERDDGAAPPFDQQYVVVPAASGLPENKVGIEHGDDGLGRMARGGVGVYHEGGSDFHPGSTSPFDVSAGDPTLGKGRSLRGKLGIVFHAHDDPLSNAYKSSGLGGPPHMNYVAAYVGLGQSSPDGLRSDHHVEHLHHRGNPSDHQDQGHSDREQKGQDDSPSDQSDDLDDEDAGYPA